MSLNKIHSVVASDTIHASTVAINNQAVVIRGASGSGKSGLALQLLALGAGLVADDQTTIWRQDDCVMADAPESISGKVEARGLGLLHAPSVGPCKVGLVVDLDQTEPERLPPFRETQLLDHPITLIRKSGFNHFPAAILLYLRHGRWH